MTADISAEEWHAMQVTVKTLVEQFNLYQEHLVDWAKSVGDEVDRLFELDAQLTARIIKMEVSCAR